MCLNDICGVFLLLYLPNKFINSCADKTYRVTDLFSVVFCNWHEAKTYQGHSYVRQWCVVITRHCFFYVHKPDKNKLSSPKGQCVDAMCQRRLMCGDLTYCRTDNIEIQHTNNKCLIKF